MSSLCKTNRVRKQAHRLALARWASGGLALNATRIVGVIRPHGRFSVHELWRNNEKALHDWLLMEGAIIAWCDDPSNQSFRFTISSCRPLGVVSDDPSGRRL